MIAKLNIRLLALLFSLVFIQHGSLRLFMHHWLHTTNVKNHAQNTPASNSEFSKCNCIDEALTPFVTADFSLQQVFYTIYISPSFYFKIEIFTCLRFFSFIKSTTG